MMLVILVSPAFYVIGTTCEFRGLSFVLYIICLVYAECMHFKLNYKLVRDKCRVRDSTPKGLHKFVLVTLWKIQILVGNDGKNNKSRLFW